MGIPAWVIVLLLMVVDVGAVTYVLIGPPSTPQTQRAGAAVVQLVGLEPNPLYGNLLEWDYWHVDIIENSYTITQSMRPVITVQGLTACSYIVLQASSDQVSWSGNLVSQTPDCTYDVGALYNKNVVGGGIGAVWYFRHEYTSSMDQWGDAISFTAQLVQ